MILTVQLMPATPTPLLPAAPIVPATCVPWPWSSVGLLSFPAKSQPCQSSTNPLWSLSIPSVRQPLQFSPGLTQICELRSGCDQSTPVSITATVTFGLPVVTFHASGASMSASKVPGTPLIACPVLLRPHVLPNNGSFGSESIVITWFGSAYLTRGSLLSFVIAASTSPEARCASEPWIFLKLLFSSAPTVFRIFCWSAAETLG